ncbi:MAG: tRNA epoxyqueuosine(34) reductase QueG [Rubripirellula sp.]
MIDRDAVVRLLQHRAADEGFQLFGIAPAISLPGFPKLVKWIESGYAGGMDYLANRQPAYQHPSGVLQGARSIIVLTYPYATADHAAPEQGRGKVARYVWSGDDYHDTIHPKLKRLCRDLQEALPESNARGVVDTAPLLEREVASLAGLGWTGKNTLLLNKEHGSYFFLACVLTDQELPYDNPHSTSHCGTCTACLDACPTDAFPQPGVLDATRCISYLTIEHRDPIPIELRDGIGDWLFGCDVCQEVCPWNRKPSRTASKPTTPLDAIELTALFTLNDDDFRQQFRKTPLWRTRRRGILRNAAIVLGNQRSVSSVTALVVGLNDTESIVRGASAWALGRIGSKAAITALQRRRTCESEEDVRQEIDLALEPSPSDNAP